MKTALLWIGAILVFLVLPMYIGIPLLLIFIGYMWYRGKKNKPVAKKLTDREQAQLKMQQTNREIISNYQNNTKKVTKDNKKKYELSKQDVKYWTENVQILLKQIIDNENIFAKESSLSSMGFGNELFVILEDIAARIIDNPKELLRFDPVLQNLLPGFSTSANEYSEHYQNNLIANDPKIAEMLEKTRQQLKGLASAMQTKYRECLNSDAQSLSDAMSFSNAVIHTESKRIEQQKQDSSLSNVSVEDLLKNK
ncbi:5-bromo-4-chloroindolyl phosphate hydrolysis family protein [Lactiplantibacillus plajomi]|uniref:5-bromo-4-chloroindolyl phosphate hydrolysis family protein n=1 Tax=Lactiplantibacillus plajomi TaxID=1457217 RepID=A0ABV6K3G6_9LACO|nr:5-bromo-4-chloroindolyl phosphate hydrolysis family protein [Lactiplantibacillus plajomi]